MLKVRHFVLLEGTQPVVLICQLNSNDFYNKFTRPAVKESEMKMAWNCFNQKTPDTIVAVNLYFDECAVVSRAPQ